MKKLLLILMVAILGIDSSFAQEREDFFSCGTRKMTDEEKQALPWYGNNQFLYDFLDSLEGKGSNLRMEGVSFEGNKVPVQAWVYRRDDGSGVVPQDFHVMNLLNAANEILELNDVKIQFYLVCSVIPLNNTFYYSEIVTDGQHENMLRENHNPNALNVHFVRGNRADPPWGGKANFPSDNPPYSFAQTTSSFVFLRNNPTTPDEYLDAATTFLHEFGHCMNLLHTHSGKWWCDSNSECGNCKQEYVDRDRRLGELCWAGGIGNLAAEVNGDLLIDTEADPKLLSNNTRWVDTDCNYRPSFTDTDGNFRQISHTMDNDGDIWTPPTRNIMSYSRRSCRRASNSITRGQEAIMYSSLELYRFQYPFPFWPKIIYNDNEVDEYENDNHFMAADSVAITSFPRRHHTFHLDSGSWGTPQACDEDWIKFGLTTIRKVIAVTRPAPISGNQVNADTRLELYREITNPDGIKSVQLIASDDDGSQYGTGFSRIERILSQGNYYVRVVSQNKLPGHYVIGIFPERENWGSYGGGGSGGTGGNGDGEIDFEVTDTSPGGDIDGDGTLDYVCEGTQLNLQGLDNDPLWSVQWSTNNASVSATNGFIQTNGFSGEVIITALIYYNSVLVGNTMKTIWVGAPQAPTLVITGLRENNVKCEGEPIYFSANSTQGFATSYTWKIYRAVQEVYQERTQSSYLGSNATIRNLPVGDYFATVSACNDCGCNESDFVEFRVISKDEQCTSFIPDRGKIRAETNLRTQLVIYPNPVSHQLTIKLPSSYSENPTQIELYNSIGQLVLSNSYTKTNIELSLSSLPKGLYILKIQNGEVMRTEKIIIE